MKHILHYKFFIAIILNLLNIGCNDKNSDIPSHENKSIINIDTIKSENLESYLENYSDSIIENSSIYDFYIGENENIKELKKWNTLSSNKKQKENKFFYLLPTNKSYKNKKLNIKCLVDFNYKDKILYSISISYSVPFDFIAPHLLKINKPRTVKQLDDYLKTKQHETDFSSYQMNALVIYQYLTDLSKTIEDFFTEKYGKPVVIINSNVKNNLMYLSNEFHEEKNSLLWTKNGKYIKLDFANSPKNAETIAIRGIDNDESILIGNAIYSTIKFMK